MLTIADRAALGCQRDWRKSGRGAVVALLAVLTLGLWPDRPAPAQSGESVLQSVDVTNLPGNRVQLRFQLSQTPPEPRAFTINDPARIVLDLPATRSGLSEPEKTIGSGVAERVTVLEGGDRTRASVSLARLVPYAVRREGNAILLTLEAGAEAVPASIAAAPAPVAGAAGAAAPAPAPVRIAPVVPAASATLLPKAITGIDFRRGAEGQAIISVVLADPSTRVDVREEGNRIVADFIGARLPRDQERRLDVTDFATPVLLVDALNQGDNARLAVQPTGLYEYLAYQTEDRYTIEVKPVKEEEVEDPQQKTYTGELLSLNFQDIEVRAVLQIIADFTGLNVVVSDTVSGNLTLRLQNVPWDQALDIILRTKGLTQRQNGNVIYIAPTEEIAAREQLELEATNRRSELVPLRSELIQVNYAKAEDIGELLKQVQGAADTEGGTVETASLLSARGSVTVDPRTNTLLVQDVPDKLSEIRSLISRLDVPVRQVLVDSRVVIANSDFSRELGVRFGATGVGRNGNYGVVGGTGSLEGTDNIINSAVSNLGASGQPFPTAVPSLNNRLGVNLPVANPAGRLALAILGQDYLVDLELSALQAEGRGETLSNPRLLTTDRYPALIKQGFEVPYTTVSDGGTNVEFKEAVLKLEVTPQITPDNRIIMDLIVTKDEPDFGRAINGNPPLNKREINTQVLVDNGETVVLGGVFEQVTSNSVSKVPLLGDIPAIGNLFKRNARQNDKLELLIFVTPQIVTSGVAIR